MKFTKCLFVIGLMLSTVKAWSVGTVQHTHHCPAYFLNQESCVKYIIPSDVPTDTPIDFDLFFYQDQSDTSLPMIPVKVDGELSVSLMMGHHGHGSAPADVEMIEAGHYKVKNASFLMPGMWSIDMKICRYGEEKCEANSLFIYLKDQ